MNSAAGSSNVLTLSPSYLLRITFAPPVNGCSYMDGPMRLIAKSLNPRISALHSLPEATR